MIMTGYRSIHHQQSQAREFVDLRQPCCGRRQVLEQLAFKNVDIFVLYTVLTIPTSVSDLLCKPLIAKTTSGFVKFGGSLQKAGLLDTVDNGNRTTVRITFILDPYVETNVRNWDRFSPRPMGRSKMPESKPITRMVWPRC
jgi:hypothetical protein